MHDPVAVALKRRAQRAVLLRARPARRVGARRQRREQLLLLVLAPRSAKPAATVSFPLAMLTVDCLSARGASRRARAQSMRRAAVTQWLHFVCSPGPRRTPAPRCSGAGRLSRRGRVDPQVDAVLVQATRSSAASTKRSAWPRRGDQQAVEDVLLGRAQHAADGAHLLAVARRARARPSSSTSIGDRQALVHGLQR